MQSTPERHRRPTAALVPPGQNGVGRLRRFGTRPIGGPAVLRLTVARADASGRLRVGRLHLATAPAGGGAERPLWPHRWHHNIVVLHPEWTPTPLAEQGQPVLLLPDSRLRLPASLCAALDVLHQQVLVACDGRELWLTNPAWLAPRLP